MTRRLPTAALLLGLAGLIPFIGCGLAAVSPGSPEQAARAMLALIAYGAVILAFLGGVHWGFVLEHPTDGAADPNNRRENARLILGVVPSLIGWVALLAPFLGGQEVALAILIAGFVATIATESRLRRGGLVPPGYMMLRWALSVVVLLTLITVFTLTLLDAKIIF